MNGLYGGTTLDIVRHSSGALIAATNNGLWRSTNDGGSWTSITTGTDLVFADLDIDNAGNVFAISSTRVYKSSDAGATFANLGNTGITSSGVKIKVATAGNIFVAGQDNQLYRSTNSGTNFSVSFSFGSTINDLDTDENSLVYVSTSNNGLQISASAAAIAFNSGGGSISSGSVIYSTEISSSGDIYTLSTDGVHRSTNGGSIFTAVNGSIAEGSYGGKLVFSSGSLFLLNNSTKKYFSTANPTSSPPTWTAGVSYPVNLDVNNLLVQSASIQYLAFSGYGISKTTNSGGIWSFSSSGMKAFDRNPRTFVTPTNRILIGWEGIGYYLSIDDGNTFDLVASTGGNTNRQLNGFLTLDDGSILGYGNGVIRSTDNGTSWSVQNAAQFLSSVVTTDSVNLFSYDGNLLTSNDLGVTWNTQSISGLPFANKIQVDNSNNLYFRASNNLYKVNAGETTASLIFGTTLVSDFVVVNDVILIVNGTTLYRSDNGGAVFSSKTIPNSNRVWAYFDGLDQTIFVHNNSTGTFNTSVDGGSTWQPHILPDSKAQIYDFIVTTSNIGFASANKSISLKTTSKAVLPAAPSDLEITAYTFNTVQLEWKDNSSIEANFEIERSVGDNTTYDFVGSFISSAPLPNSISQPVTGTPGEINFFRIRAVNSGGESYSNEVSIVLPTQCISTIPDNRSWTLTVTGDPGSTPSGPIVNANALIKRTGNTGNTFTIDNYHLGINGVSTDFIASFNENCGETFIVSNTFYHPNGNGTWDDVNKILTLKWRSRANDPVFEGTSTLALNAVDPVPGTPGLSVYSVSSTEALISWNQTGFENEYVIERATTPGGPSYTALPPISYPTVYFIDDNLTNGGTYYYRIQAKNAQGSSPFSAEQSVTLANGLFRPTQNILAQNFDTQQGGSWGDLDGDGWEDLVVARSANNTGQALPPAFFRNLGATQPGQFEQIELPELSEEGNGSLSINIFDFNNDEKLDVYVARAGIGVSDLLLLNLDNNWGFSKTEILPTGEINAIRNAVAFDYDSDGLVDIVSCQRDFNVSFEQPGDLLLRNIGGSNLAEVTTTPLKSQQNSSGSVSAIDYDNDGDQDVFVINFSTSTPVGHLFNNDGDGTFTKVTGSIFDTENLVLPSTASWGDIDNDGDFDLYVGQFLNLPGFRDRLYRNNGDGSFTNLSGSAVAEENTSTFGSAFGDIDNDGDVDLIVANGKLITSGAGTNNSVFFNDGLGNFTKYTGLEIVTHPNVSNLGMAMADFDNDGFLDLYTGKGLNTEIDLPNFIYENTMTQNGSRHWVKIKLVGTESNSAGIGARIKITTSSPSRSQIREIATRTGYGSMNSLLAHFGLGTATAISQIEIKWPSGNIQTLNNLSTIDQTLTIVEDIAGPTFTFNPAANATAAAIGNTVSFTLDEDATPIAGKFIVIRKGSVGATPLQTIDVSAGIRNGNTFAYTLTASTEYETTYFISIDAGAFIDSYQNLSLGVSPAEWSFTTSEPPDLTFPIITFNANEYISLPKGFGTQQKLNAIASDNKAVTSFIMHYRKITATQFSQVFGTVTGASTYEFPLLESFFDDMGMEFYLEAKDAADNTTLDPPSGYHKIKLEFDDTNTTLSIAAGSSVNSFQIRSVPFENLPSNQISVLFDELGQPDGTQYRVLKYQNSPEEWIEYPNGFNSVARGEGYFMIARNGANIKFGSAESPSNSQSNLFSVDLIAGWNLIGNPYTVTASWNESIAGLTGVGGLKVYQNGAYVDGNEMAIFSGGFVFADQAQQVPIKMKTSASGGRTRRFEFNSELDKSEWLVPLTLKQDDTEFLLGGIGMHPEARDSYDDFDDLAPPAIQDRLEIAFDHPEHFMNKFSRDMVPTAENHQWEFDVISGKTTEMTIFWNPDLFGENSKELVLYDPITQQIVNMRDRDHYAFDPKMSSRLKIYFGENLADKIKPEIVSLGFPTPNPTSIKSSIGFTIPGHVNLPVKVDVYDMMGRRVINLVEDELAPGFYSVDWNVENEPSGLYTYRLSAGTQTTTRKVIVNR